MSRVQSTAYGGRPLTDFPGYAIQQTATGNDISFELRGVGLRPTVIVSGHTGPKPCLFLLVSLFLRLNLFLLLSLPIIQQFDDLVFHFPRGGLRTKIFPQLCTC